MAKEHLLTLATAYCADRGIEPSTLATYIADGGAFFKNLENGASCTLKKYTRLLQWFSDNWPEDLAWPRGIPRPPKSKEAA